MKRLILFSAVLCMLLLSVASCKEVKPDFRFNLDLSGIVEDSATHINADFVGHVANDSVVNFYSSNYEGKVMSINSEEGKEASEWLDTYMYDNVLNDLNAAGTKYSITVRGRVRETVSGVEFSVYKTFTNKDATL